MEPQGGARMEPQAILGHLSQLDDNTISSVMAQMLQLKPELAPGLVAFACPDLTYAPSKALNERRCSGVIKRYNQQLGYGFIACAELNAVFGCDVFVHRKQMGQFMEGQEVNFAVTLNKDNKPQAFDLLDSMGSMSSMGAIGGMGGVGGMCGMGGMCGGAGSVGGMGGMAGMGAMGGMAGMGAVGGIGSMAGMNGAGGLGAMGAAGGMGAIGSTSSPIGAAGAGMGAYDSMGGAYGDGCMAGSAGMVAGAPMGCCGGMGGMGGVAMGGAMGSSAGCMAGMGGGVASMGPIGGMDAMGGMGGGMGVGMGMDDMGMGSGMVPMQPLAGGKKGGGKGGSQVILGEFLGVVKSFNAEKGFGFIACDALREQSNGDVYLHSKHVGDFRVGAEVRFQAYLHNGRLQGRELQDATGMVGPQTGSLKESASKGTEMGVFTGRIKKFDTEKGYGFITCEELSMQGYPGDVFLHARNVDRFTVGDEVGFTVYNINGKLQARELQDASASAVSAAKKRRMM